MTKITKSELAERLGVSAPRVTQYLKEGLPVLQDGAIDLPRALKWIAGNVLGPAGDRAREQLREIEAEEPNPGDALANAALGVLFAIIPGVAADAAREAGAGADVVERLPRIAHRLAEKAAREAVARFGIGTRDEWPDLELCKKLSVKEG